MENRNAYIDIHSHILPEIDDGASDIEESLRMLRLEVAEGVSHVIATPHYDLESCRQKKEVIQEKVAQLNQESQKHNMGITVHPGAEILFGPGILERLQKKEIQTLCNTSYVLIEFYPIDSFQTIYQAVGEVLQCGYTPIIAHVERYECLIKHAAYLEEIQKLGVYMQMNTRSMLGKKFSQRTRLCKNYIQSGYIQFLGSDCHNTSQRPPCMKKAVDILQKWMGDDRTAKLTHQNAELLLQGKYI